MPHNVTVVVCPRKMKNVLQNLKKISTENPDEWNLLRVSVLYPYSFRNPAPISQADLARDYQTKIYVTERDCLEASAVLATLESSQCPLILNMANSYNCGGSFCSYGGSQEEYIFRNTSVVASLWPHRREDDNRWKAGDKLFPARVDPIYYPFTNCGAVYSPHVQVFNFKHTCSIISLAQQDLRHGRSYNSENEFSYELTIQNFRSLFSIASLNGHNTLILGAIGCGAFKNPPKEISRAFHELLQNGGEFHNVFHTIIFAIIKSTENLQAFEERFGESVELESVLFPE